MNVLDSELVLSQLRARGYVTTENRHEAEVIVYNTCSVREHAEQKVWSRLGELKERKESEPELVVGVIGCMAERDGTNLLNRFPVVDVLCGPGELDKLPGLIHNAVVANKAHAESASSMFPPAKQVALMGKAVRRSSTLDAAQDNLEMLDLSRTVSPSDDISQAYVRITRGCNKFCTYCVVPYTRGPEVHRPPQNVIDEVKMLVDAGAKEVTLLGQTINHYHFEHGDGRETSFAELLYLVHEAVPGLPRLRFVTSFPRDFTDEALMAMRDCSRICRYLHAPAQHGSDRILKMMNRGYTAEAYYDFVARAKQYMPDVSIASDFIVGFPTETDQEFEQTEEMIRRCQFKNSFIFKYSPRPGTIAIDRFEDDIPEEVKRKRNNRLLAVQQEATLAENMKLVGQTLELMVEGMSKVVSRREAAEAKSAKAGGVQLTIGGAYPRMNVGIEEAESRPTTTTQLIGRTRGDQIVVFDGSPSLKGELVMARVNEARGMTLFGEQV